MIGRRDVAKWVAVSAAFMVSGGPVPARDPYRISILSSEGERDARVEQIREGLADLGYVEGRNIYIDAEFADGNPDRAAELARSVISSHPDVIVTLGFAAWPVKRQTSSIPVVVAFSGDLLSTGLVDSMARPGGNITGFSLMSTDLAAKRLQLLAEACAGVRHVGVLYDPDEVATVPELAETRAAANKLGVRIRPLAAKTSDDLDAAFARLAGEPVDALIVFAHSFAFRWRGRIIALTRASGLPTMFGWRQFVDEGGLMSYGPDVLATVRRTADYVDRILRGAHPGELPVRQPETFQLAVNLKTAQEMHLRIAPEIIARADIVIGR